MASRGWGRCLRRRCGDGSLQLIALGRVVGRILQLRPSSRTLVVQEVLAGITEGDRPLRRPHLGTTSRAGRTARTTAVATNDVHAAFAASPSPWPHISTGHGHEVRRVVERPLPPRLGDSPRSPRRARRLGIEVTWSPRPGRGRQGRREGVPQGAWSRWWRLHAQHLMAAASPLTPVASRTATPAIPVVPAGYDHPARPAITKIVQPASSSSSARTTATCSSGVPAAVRYDLDGESVDV